MARSSEKPIGLYPGYQDTLIRYTTLPALISPYVTSAFVLTTFCKQGFPYSFRPWNRILQPSFIGSKLVFQWGIITPNRNYANVAIRTGMGFLFLWQLSQTTQVFAGQAYQKRWYNCCIWCHLVGRYGPIAKKQGWGMLVKASLTKKWPGVNAA